MSHLTESMVEQFIEVEKENARGVLRKEMDSAMDTIFKQMQRKLMQLVKSGRGRDVTGHGLAHLGDLMDREQPQHSSSNATSRILFSSINSRAQLSDLNVSNQSYQGGLNDLVYYGQQLYETSNQIPTSTSTNQSHVPDNATSNQIHYDEITVKNEIGEMVNIIPNDESIPSSSPQSQPSNDEQANNNIDDLFDDEEEDCDCPDCVGDAFFKIENDHYQEIDDDDDVQLIEDLGKNDDSSSRNKRPRIEKDQAQDHAQEQSQDQAQPNNQTNQCPFIIISLKCPQCSQMFKDKTALNAHLKVVHSIAKFRCLYKDCTQSFDNKMHLGHHYRTTHPTQTNAMWPCGYCTGLFKNAGSLLHHYTSQHQEGIFRCSHPDCKFVGELKQTVINHFGINHREIICQYPNCAKRFPNATQLRSHQRSHRDVRPYRCKWPDCQFDCAYLSQAMHHIRSHLARSPDGLHSTDPKDYLEVLHYLI